MHQSFERFKTAGLIYEVEGDTDGYLPARALEDITLATLVDAVEGEMTMHFAQGLPSESGAACIGDASAVSAGMLGDGYGRVFVVRFGENSLALT